jgi:hypothetical protein
METGTQSIKASWARGKDKSGTQSMDKRERQVHDQSRRYGQEVHDQSWRYGDRYTINHGVMDKRYTINHGIMDKRDRYTINRTHRDLIPEQVQMEGDDIDVLCISQQPMARTAGQWAMRQKVRAMLHQVSRMGKREK